MNIDLSAQEVTSYFQEHLQPIFTRLIAKITLTRPEDICEFAIKELKYSHSHSDSQSEEGDAIEEIGEQQFARTRKNKLEVSRGRRYGISAEANTTVTSSRRAINMIKTGIKSEGLLIKIKFYFMNSFLFKDLQEEEQGCLIESLVEKNFEQGQLVLQEGCMGQCMYFVDEGVFQSRNKQNKIQIFQPGDAFQQICLLYPCKRMVTVTSTTSGRLYSISRDIYKHVKKMSIIKRRELYQQSLAKVAILAQLSSEEREKMIDGLRERRVQADEYVIHQGDMGSKFFIVLQGLLVAKKGSQENFIQYYKEGDYFGQIALIQQKQRQASVQAVTKTRLVYLTRQVFLNVVNRDKANSQLTSKYRQSRQNYIQRRNKDKKQTYLENN